MTVNKTPECFTWYTCLNTCQNYNILTFYHFFDNTITSVYQACYSHNYGITNSKRVPTDMGKGVLDC